MRINNMRFTRRLSGKILVGITAAIYACAVFAAENTEDEKKKNCRKPKFYDFAPAHLATAAPESEISFKVARAKSPEYVTLEVKKISVPLIAENKDVYYIMKGKLPAELRDTYARVNVRAEADGGCHVEDGWLVKISE
jgi:hypothetical protein